MSHMNQAIEQRISAERVIDDGDMLLRRALPTGARHSVGPFVFVDHYRHVSRRGIGSRPHPHAGIEVISYLLEGAIAHRDSMGFEDRIEAGDVQWIRAGRGMLHAEMPDGGRHGLQMWTMLPPDLNRGEPCYERLPRRLLPSQTHGGCTVRVIAGTVNDLSGPMRLARPTTLAHLTFSLEATTEWQLVKARAEELAVYVLAGGIEIRGAGEVEAGTLSVLASGQPIALRPKQGSEAEILLIGGDRIREQILFDGPFVMDTPDKLTKAWSDYHSGVMGRLDGVPF